MNKNLNYTLIETTVRNTIKKIKDDPERSVRNLVDLALSFSQSRFQQRFFKSAQTMLKNQNSSYYKLIPDIVANVDTERIVSFGMNVGYNSCTVGAKQIREIEAAERFNIPWCIALELNGNDYRKNPSVYHSLISQGKELGIYSWVIHTLGHPSYIMELINRFPDCAFVLLCASDEITHAFLDEAENINNVMFALEYDDFAEDACSLLRSRSFLYSVYSETKITNEHMLDELLCDTENLHAAFTFLLSSSESDTESASIHQLILQKRTEQNHRTVPFDLLLDTHMIDSIISERAGLICFDRNGACYSLNSHTLYEDYNFMHDTLRDILKKITQIETP